jgi:hypothetical protein
MCYKYICIYIATNPLMRLVFKSQVVAVEILNKTSRLPEVTPTGGNHRTGGSSLPDVYKLYREKGGDVKQTRWISCGVKPSQRNSLRSLPQRDSTDRPYHRAKFVLAP